MRTICVCVCVVCVVLLTLISHFCVILFSIFFIP